MISLQRSMHSSQMYTPGPAMSFLTWRCDLPQKLQRSCSLPSLARAIPVSPFTRFRAEWLGRGLRSARFAVRDHSVDDAVLRRLLRAHVEVALHFVADLLLRLSGFY